MIPIQQFRAHRPQTEQGQESASDIFNRFAAWNDCVENPQCFARKGRVEKLDADAVRDWHKTVDVNGANPRGFPDGWRRPAQNTNRFESTSSSSEKVNLGDAFKQSPGKMMDYLGRAAGVNGRHPGTSPGANSRPRPLLHPGG